MTHPIPVEVLEARIAPAFVLAPEISADGKSATFVDVDGDVFNVTTSKGAFTQGNFIYTGEAETGPGYLQQINLGLAMFGKMFQGAKITIAVDQLVGDGFADVGFINAAGIDLKEIVIDGDLVRIDVGDANFKTPAIKLLQAGQLGFHTAGDAGTPDFVSLVTGKIEVLNIDQWADASISVTGGPTEKSAKFGSVGRASIVSMTGSDLAQSGTLRTTGSIGKIVVQGDLTGGTASETGAIFSGRNIGSATVGGSVVGGPATLSGGIYSSGKITTLTLNADLKAGSALHSGSIIADSAKTITIGGNLIGGASVSGIFVEKVLTRLTLGGTEGADGHANIVAGGPAAGGIAISKLTVTGSMSGAQVLAGYNSQLAVVNSNARIGKVTVGEDLIATSIVAGIDGVNGIFGDADDQVDPAAPKPKYLSSIGTILVDGMIEGTDGGTDQFAILAEKIGSIKIGGVPLPLGKKTIDDLQLGTFGDYRLREIALI
jgi:hypothetical protein